MTTLASLILFYLGATLGSFLSVVIYRIHNNEKGILFGRSHCPHCKRLLVGMDLIPIASYIMLKGRCRHCQEKISPNYIVIELFTGVVMGALYLRFPFLEFAVTQNIGLDNPLLFDYIRNALMGLILTAIFFYDLLYREIPDFFTYAGIIIALTGNLIAETPLPREFIPGAALGALFFEVQLLLSRGKWIGSGDVILGMLMGTLLGWKLLILSLFIAYLLGSLLSIWLLVAKKVGKSTKIPFAPFLVTGTILSVLFGSEVLDWYLGIFLV